MFEKLLSRVSTVVFISPSIQESHRHLQPLYRKLYTSNRKDLRFNRIKKETLETCRVSVAQSVETWLGNCRVAGSRPPWTSMCTECGLVAGGLPLSKALDPYTAPWGSLLTLSCLT